MEQFHELIDAVIEVRERECMGETLYWFNRDHKEYCAEVKDITRDDYFDTLPYPITFMGREVKTFKRLEALGTDRKKRIPELNKKISTLKYNWKKECEECGRKLHILRFPAVRKQYDLIYFYPTRKKSDRGQKMTERIDSCRACVKKWEN